MNKIALLLMGLLIFSGVALVSTPLIMETLYPADEYKQVEADDTEVARALKVWFGDVKADISESQGKLIIVEGRTLGFFAFHVERSVVERFIARRQLKQLALNDGILQQVFYSNQAPAFWWQPGALKRKTYFQGVQGDRQLSLIYNAQSQRGVFIVEQLPSP